MTDMDEEGDVPEIESNEVEPITESNATLAASELDADILFVNAPVAPGLASRLRDTIEARAGRRSSVIVVLITAGGIADDAYRSATAIRALYERVSICVPGWCKSAGTLMAIGADDLILGCNGEMGPLDVQIAVKDDLTDSRDSGLILNEAVSGLTESAFKVFEKFMTSIIERSRGAITFRTAADLAAQVTIGLMAPVYEKIDPLRMGADQRAQRIGMDYAMRLNLRANNLNGVEALNMLLNGYPSHGFAIDLEEARRIFRNVKALDGYLEKAIGELGRLAWAPADDAIVCYLDGDEDGKDAEEGEPAPDRHDAEADGSADGGAPAAAEELRGDFQAVSRSAREARRPS